MNDLPQPLDVIAVGAHPDDVEIGCGGTLAVPAAQGYRVGIVDLTDGEPTPRSSDAAYWMVNIARGIEQMDRIRFESLNPIFLIAATKPAA